MYHLQEVEEKESTQFLVSGMKMDPICENNVPPVKEIASLNALLMPGNSSNEPENDVQEACLPKAPTKKESPDEEEAAPQSPSAPKEKTKEASYVAKLAIDPYEDPGTYFRDVEMQAHCGLYADLYNSYDPPRKVEFCKAWILELIERDGSPLCGVEKFIEGGTGKPCYSHKCSLAKTANI